MTSNPVPFNISNLTSVTFLDRVQDCQRRFDNFGPIPSPGTRDLVSLSCHPLVQCRLGWEALKKPFPRARFSLVFLIMVDIHGVFESVMIRAPKGLEGVIVATTSLTRSMVKPASDL